jgi:hypothetical protein
LLDSRLGYRFARKLPEHGWRITLRRIKVFAQSFRNAAGGLQTFCLDFRASSTAFCFGAARFSTWHADSGSSPHALCVGGSWKVLGQAENTASGDLSFCLYFRFSRAGKGAATKEKVATRKDGCMFVVPNPFPNPREPADAETDPVSLAGPISRQGISRGKPACVEIDPSGLPVSVSRRAPCQGSTFIPDFGPVDSSSDIRESPGTRPADFSRFVSTSDFRAKLSKDGRRITGKIAYKIFAGGPEPP